MKKKAIIFISAILALSSTLTYADSTPKEANPTYHCDVDNPVVNGELTPIWHVTFPDNTKLSMGLPDNTTFLMVDGTFIPSASIIIDKNRSLVPIRVISETLGAKVTWMQDEKRIAVDYNSKTLSMKIGSTTVTINGKDTVMDAMPQLIGDKTYVPLRIIAEAMKLNVGYTDGASRLISNKSVVTVDPPYSGGISKDEARTFLENRLTQTSKEFLKRLENNNLYDAKRKDAISEALGADIKNMSFTYDISRYHAFIEGTYVIYADKFTKNVYVNHNGGVRHNEIEKIDFNDPSFFEWGYLHD